ncbi:MAG: diguanylate cyclase (GGDEF)-like protein [Sulfurimonas sp.]|jgi:diguanylate cyclase (GGDEF)-like protein
MNSEIMGKKDYDFADGSYKGMFETTKIPMYDDENNLEKSAHLDELTGLVNRALFMERLSQLLRQRKADTNIHAILFIDLDHLKDINDEKGHATGDKVLIEVAHRLKPLIRKGDKFAKFVGDEFTILLENIHSNGEASKVAQKILDKLREEITIDESKYHVTSSIGISLSPANSTDNEVYRAKSSGKDAYSFFKRD